MKPAQPTVESINGRTQSAEVASRQLRELSKSNFAAASVAAGLDIMAEKATGSSGCVTKTAVTVIEHAIELAQKSRFEEKIKPIITFIDSRLVKNGSSSQRFIEDYLRGSHEVFTGQMLNWEDSTAYKLGLASRSLVSRAVEMMAKEAVHRNVSGLSPISLGGIARAVELDMVKYLFNATLNEDEQHLHQTSVIGGVVGLIQKVMGKGEKIVEPKVVDIHAQDMPEVEMRKAKIELHKGSNNVTLTIPIEEKFVAPHEIHEVANEYGLSEVPKQHITLLGFEQGKKVYAILMEMYDNNEDKVLEAMQGLIDVSNIEYKPTQNWFVARKKFIHPAYLEKPITEETRTTLVQYCDATGVSNFYRKLYELTRQKFYTPELHVTQFSTSTDPERIMAGIGFVSLWELQQRKELVENIGFIEGQISRGTYNYPE